MIKLAHYARFGVKIILKINSGNTKEESFEKLLTNGINWYIIMVKRRLRSDKNVGR